MLFGLEICQVEAIKEVFKQFISIDKAIIYGSRAKGNFKAGSDIDVTLLGEHLSYKDLVNISMGLDDLLLPYEFDVSIYNDIENEELLLHIKRVGIAFYQK